MLKGKKAPPRSLDICRVYARRMSKERASSRRGGRTLTIQEPNVETTDRTDQAADHGIREAAALLREAVARKHEADSAALLGYRAEVERSLGRFQADLDVATAKLKAERAVSNPELRESLTLAQGPLRTAVDELRVRASIGRMDLRDARTQLVTDSEGIGHGITAMLEELAHDTADSLDDLRKRSLKLVRDVRRFVVAMGRAEDEDVESPGG